MRAKWVILVIVVAVAGFLVLTKLQNNTAQAGELDAFAQCLAAGKVTMYGADWCSHCQNEKKAFGSSFQYVPYVECPKDPKACLEKDIKGYPTWIFPDGKKMEGEQGALQLSFESGCALPSGYKTHEK